MNSAGQRWSISGFASSRTPAISANAARSMNGDLGAANARPANCAPRAGGNMRGPACRREQLLQPAQNSPAASIGAMWRAVAGVVPGIAITVQGFRGGNPLGRYQPLQRGHPVPVIGFAGIGIAGGLRAGVLASVAAHSVQLEQPALMQLKRQSVKVRASQGSSACETPALRRRRICPVFSAAVVALRRKSITLAPHPARNASTDTLKAGSASKNPNSALPNTTV